MKVLCISKNIEKIRTVKNAANKAFFNVDVLNAINDALNVKENYFIIFIDANLNSNFDSLSNLMTRFPLSSVILLMDECNFECSLLAMRIGVKNILVNNEINTDSIEQIIRDLSKQTTNDANLQKEINSKYFNKLIFKYDDASRLQLSSYLNDFFSLHKTGKKYSAFMIHGLEFEKSLINSSNIQIKAERDEIVNKLIAFSNSHCEIAFVFYIENRFYSIIVENNVANVDISSKNIINNLFEYSKNIFGNDITIFKSNYFDDFKRINEAIDELEDMEKSFHLGKYPCLLDYAHRIVIKTNSEALNDAMNCCFIMFDTLEKGAPIKEHIDDIFTNFLLQRINYDQFLKIKNYCRFEFEMILKNKKSLQESREFEDTLKLLQLLSNADFVKKTIETLSNIVLENSKNKYNYLISKTIEMVNSDYMYDIGLYDIAKKLDISTVYLSQLFKKQTGKNFSLYLNEIRIERAKRFLDEGQKISDVYSLVGFNNLQYFSKCFKKITGKTPIEYRNK